MLMRLFQRILIPNTLMEYSIVVPSFIGIGEGVRMRKPSQSGVIATRFSGRSKKGNTSPRERGTNCCVFNSNVFTPNSRGWLMLFSSSCLPVTQHSCFFLAVVVCNDTGRPQWAASIDLVEIEVEAHVLKTQRAEG